ncbi:DgyrCDS7568 [Dimorphilus gyrociliatus]|uniref:DgyrCDS7568 n=1 Tax=Dimorphilus gyrociliatus TaxID=2664684 RepID=A0A7I8VTM9_9ANNE|nr:DgyrCDS7568 [Dimorphilus gyrociliatus]
MGCLQSKASDKGFKDPPAKQLDSRLPFENYRQFFNFKNSWKTVARKTDACAQENMLLFFERFPQHKALHTDLANLSEEQLKMSMAFQNQSEAIFNLFDDVLQKCDNNVDGAIRDCLVAGEKHKHIPGFQPEYFKDMEDTFLQACRTALEDRFSEATEQNFKHFYGFVTQQMCRALGSENNRI